MNNIAVILVNPQMGENIGAAARAMLNFGLKDLRIVNPRDGWPNQKAIDMAKGAREVVDNARVFFSIEEACHDVEKLYATTARRRDMNKMIVSLPDLPELITQNDNLKSAIVFGCEKSGLTNSEIALADAIINIPSSEEYGSINLAQAVNITCYQLFISEYEFSNEQFKSEDVCNKEQLHNFLEVLESELEKGSFFKNKDKKDSMSLNIKNIFSRSNLTNQEVNILFGIIKSLTKKR